MLSSVNNQVKLLELTNNFTMFGKNILNVLIQLSNVHLKVYPSRAYIAEKAGCSVRTVARYLNLFKAYGLLRVTRLDYKTSSLYELTIDFFDEQIRTSLSYILPACAYFQKALLQTNVLLCSYINNLYIKVNNNECILEKKDPKREQEYSTQTQRVVKDMSSYNYEKLKREAYERLVKEKGESFADDYFSRQNYGGPPKKPKEVSAIGQWIMNQQLEAPAVAPIPRQEKCSMSIEEKIRAENPNNPERVAKLLAIWNKRK